MMLLKLNRATQYHQQKQLAIRSLSIASSSTTTSASVSNGNSNESNNDAPIVVQKYGGTSLGTAERLRKVANIIKKFSDKPNNKRVVAVVSALSTETKAEGTTSRLLAAADAAVKRGDYHSYLDKIEDTHLDVVYTLLKSKERREEIRNFISSELHIVREFCSALGIIRELSPRSHDLIIGCGERLSAGLVSGVLREEGLQSAPVDLSNAFPNEIDTLKKGYQLVAKAAIREKVEPLLKKGMIPVVTGYFGNVKGGMIHGVGRGYTDLTSALTAGALGASQLQVWKESDGVFTGNPTKIATAKLISHVTPQEASELTYFGNEVLHPATMERAIEDHVPIAILNTFKPDGAGTSIVSSDHMTEEELLKQRKSGAFGVAAVCSKKNIPVLSLRSNRALQSTEFYAKAFELLAKHDVRVDLVSSSAVEMSLAVFESVPASRIAALMSDLEEIGTATIRENKAIVSCIGAGMKHQIGLASKIFQVLAAEGISLEMIAQGASEINVSVVISQEDMDKAIKAIHRAFLE